MKGRRSDPAAEQERAAREAQAFLKEYTRWRHAAGLEPDLWDLLYFMNLELEAEQWGVMLTPGIPEA